jgi:hypothetical protein
MVKLQPDTVLLYSFCRARSWHRLLAVPQKSKIDFALVDRDMAVSAGPPSTFELRIFLFGLTNGVIVPHLAIYVLV